jgi:RNA polymerase-interacting CarD/CdnL/TRCF family regulator
MNFNPGDHVVHQNFGVGTINSIEDKALAGDEPRLYYRVDFINSTVWVPVEEQADPRLRPVTPKGQLNRYRAILSSSPVRLDGDFRKRQMELLERMDKGSIQGLCQIVRDLKALETIKPLNVYEKKLYTRAWDALVPEWSITSGQTQADARQEIANCLLKSKQAFEYV